MMRHTDRPMGEPRVYTAAEGICADCGNPLPICQVISRPVQALDGQFMLVRRDRQCRRRDCPGPRPRPFVYAPRDLRAVLPGRIYGLGVTLYVGERHLRDGVSLGQITRDLNARGVPVDQRHTCRIFRDFLTLTKLERGDDDEARAQLRAQGGIVLMCDGVQFDDRSPVLYLAWDARSGTPLFGERKLYRGEDDLVPLLKRVRDMGVPVIGVVTDKEKGLVPAVKAVFPEVPYQFCHTHFLKNCAKPLQEDLTALQASVRRRADAVREITKRVEERDRSTPVHAPDAVGPDPEADPAAAEADGPVAPTCEADRGEGAPSEPSLSPASDGRVGAALTEEDLVREVGEIVRVNSRVSGKAPLAPAELARHERLAKIEAVVRDAAKKTAPRGP